MWLIHVVIELDDENFTTVARDELRYLRERNVKAELLEEENARLTEDLKGYNDASLRVEALGEENARLAAALERALQQQKLQNVGTPADPLTPRGSEPPSSVKKIEDHESNAVAREKYNALVEKCNEHILKYNQVSATYKHLKNARQVLEDELRKERHKVKDFTVHVERQDGQLARRAEKIRKQEEEIRGLRAKLDGGEATAKPPSPKPVQLITSSPIPSRGEIQVPVSPTKMMLEEDAEAESPELPNLLQEGNFNVEDTLYVPIKAHHASSTQDEASPPRKPGGGLDRAAQEPFPEHPSSDGIPVVISARSVKKRKGRHGEVEQTGTPVAKVKVERINSSPIGIAAMYHMNESIDLDDIGEKVDTPKKQRRMLELSRQASRISYASNGSDSQRTRNTPSQSQSNLATELVPEASQETPTRQAGGSRTGSALQPLSTNRQILPRTSDDKSRAHKKRRIVSDEAIGELGEDGPDSQKTPRRTANGGAERLVGLLSKPSPPKRVLSPIQVNRTEAPKAINQHTRSKASATSGLAHEVENTIGYESDGAVSNNSRKSRGSLEPTRPSSRGTPRVSVDPSRPSSRGSLRGPVEQTRPSPGIRGDRADHISRPDREHPKTPMNGSRPTSRDSAGHSRPTSSKGRTPKPGEASTKRTPRPRANAMGLQWDTPGNEPLRTRPVGVLGLEDFKVNPAYNQGYDYAFKDVVRKKDERRCLPGCTRPDCCGNKFRALAQLLQDTASDRPYTLSQEDRDQELLEEFMGDNAYKLNNMSAEERKEMLLQAKTRDLANKNGRHRHAYDRRPSPPGFWEADFPTTQEELQNREKSKEYVRRLVEERYAEAMRPGGAYIFRDE